MDEQENEYRQRLEERRKKREALRRKRQMQQRIIYAAAALVLILIIVLIARGCGKDNTDTKDKALTEMTVEELTARAKELGVDLTGIESDKAAIIAAIEEFSNAQKPDQPDDSSVDLPLVDVAATATLSAVGDIMVYDSQISDAKQPDGSYDFSHCFAGVAELLSASDLTVGNLETNFCGGTYSGYPNFNAPESLASNLAAVGFDILQTANTYSIQNGLTGLASTYRYVAAAGMAPLGTYYSETQKQDNGGVLVREVGGIKFAFFAYTKGVNNMYLPDGSEYAVDVLYKDYYSNYTQIDTSAITASIDAAKATGADVIVAMVHWGSEYELEPSSSQEQIADLMFRSGVDVILGSHSHMVGPMEMRTVTTDDGTEKEVFLAYSLGNFLSSMTADFTQDSVILNLEFSKDSDGNTTISNANYVPVYIADNGEDAEGRYVLLDAYAEIDKYVGGAADRVSDTIYNALKLDVDTLHQNAGAAFDRSNQAS